MNPKSHTLFHFTKSKETIKTILTTGFWPRYCLEDIRWIGQSNYEYVGFPVVCFCDIPLSRISEHVGFYGEYGIGLTKEWATSNGLNPVLYIAGDNDLGGELRRLNKHANKLEDEDSTSAKKTMRYIFSYIKPAEGYMVVDGRTVPKEFYQESEWRYVPQCEDIEAYLPKKQFENDGFLEAQNELTKQHCSIKITPKDIKYIFVRVDSDIPDMINFIQSGLDHYPGADLKVLMSRVISLESIQKDL